MTGLERILAHHAGARLYQQETGQYPSPEGLARLILGGDVREELAAYKAVGCVETARAVLADELSLQMDLGQLYQHLRESREKKGLGQVFTPGPAVDAALDLANPPHPQTVIDPACGAGEFLLAAARRWPGAKLLGVDIDPLALAVARTRLALIKAENVRLIQANALNYPLAEKYDLVAGNPPWGSILSPVEVQGYSISRDKLRNSFVYFLELAARLLKPGGRMVYILPEAFGKVWTYRGARDWLLQHFAIAGLHYIPHLFKEYYAPALLMAAVRLPADKPKEIPVWYQVSLSKIKLKYNTLPTQAISPDRLSINWRPRMEELWNKCCRNSILLKEANLGAPLPPGEAVVDFSLGIVTGGNRRYVSAQPLSDKHLPVLYARDVNPFTVVPASRWLRYDCKQLQQAAPLEKYQVPEKLVYRFIAREIVAAVDYSGSLTINNLNIIVPLRIPFSLDYLSALLNSKLLNTLYMYKFFTGKVLTRHIKLLPLRTGTKQEQERISALAGELAKGQGDKAALDTIIFGLYGLSPAEEDLVLEQYNQLKKVFFV